MRTRSQSPFSREKPSTAPAPKYLLLNDKLSRWVGVGKSAAWVGPEGDIGWSVHRVLTCREKENEQISWRDLLVGLCQGVLTSFTLGQNPLEELKQKPTGIRH